VLAALEVVLGLWKEVDLESRRSAMEKQATDMLQLEEKSNKSRIELSGALKEAKKAEGDERNKKLQELVKMFKAEVDDLTQRAKFAEEAFRTLFTCLYEAPDPMRVLNSAKQALEKNLALETEMKALRTKNEMYEEEFKALKNQEVSIRRLEEENKEIKSKVIP